MQDVDNGNRVRFNHIEDQIVAEHTAANAAMLVAGNERKGKGIVTELDGSLAKLISGPQRAILRDVIPDPTQIAKGLVRKADLHNCPRSRAMPV